MRHLSTWGQDKQRPAGEPFFKKVVLLNKDGRGHESQDQPAAPLGRQNGKTQPTGLNVAGGLTSI